MFDYWEKYWKKSVLFNIKKYNKENNEIIFTMHKKKKRVIKLRNRYLNLMNDIPNKKIPLIPILKHTHQSQKREQNFIGVVLKPMPQTMSE
ncbi:hypothetical protein SCORR_v1c08760 [Spiroplasma corruscae]|uniref:Uncharacterized protein n=1 Tax=Spiroplasma corruscae TaxID=216934 RepID=A0A222EQ35_9MOLU|nr:hypothetical protein [Spiroplasma corruscae]ASP28648.1 hypothetical protein SCORR_v1c08760 [Spiroplasma corruscae]